MKNKIKNLLSACGLFSTLLVILFSLQGCDGTPYTGPGTTGKPVFPMARDIRVTMLNLYNQEVHMYVLGTNSGQNEKIGPGNKVQSHDSRSSDFAITWPDETYRASLRVGVGQNGHTIVTKLITLPYDCERKYIATFKEDGTLEIEENGEAPL